MSRNVHVALIFFSLLFVCAGGYYRLQSLRSGERLDRTKEGWLILIGIRAFGLAMATCAIALLRKPWLFAWASKSLPLWIRWLGVAGFGIAVLWLLWMFRTLGPNLTDTVVTRKNSYLVEQGPYRFVRNPMYVGILLLGLSLGVALGTWLLPLGTCLLFTLLAIRTRIEERYLIERFGERFLDYMNRVGRFFPKLR